MKRRDVRREVEDLRKGDVAKASEEVAKLKKEQFNLRFQRASGQLQNTARVRVVRRDIACTKTLAAQKRAAKKEN